MHSSIVGYLGCFHGLLLVNSASFIVCGFFDGIHFDWCEVISHCNSDFHFSNNYQCWTYFQVPLIHLYVFFGEISI